MLMHAGLRLLLMQLLARRAAALLLLFLLLLLLPDILAGLAFAVLVILYHLLRLRRLEVRVIY